MARDASLERALALVTVAGVDATAKFGCEPECECSVHWPLTVALRELKVAADEFAKWEA